MEFEAKKFTGYVVLRDSISDEIMDSPEFCTITYTFGQGRCLNSDGLTVPRRLFNVTHVTDTFDQHESLSIESSGPPTRLMNPIELGHLGEVLSTISPTLSRTRKSWKKYYNKIYKNKEPTNVNDKIKLQAENIEFTDEKSADLVFSSQRVGAALEVAGNKFKFIESIKWTATGSPRNHHPTDRTPILNQAVRQGRWDKVPKPVREITYRLLDADIDQG